MKKKREKQDDIVYIQRDLEAIKHTLDSVLRPYKGDVKNLKNDNASLRANIARREQDVEGLLRLIAREHPALIDEALGVLLDPTRRGWKTFRKNWLERLGLVPR